MKDTIAKLEENAPRPSPAAARSGGGLLAV